MTAVLRGAISAIVHDDAERAAKKWFADLEAEISTEYAKLERQRTRLFRDLATVTSSILDSLGLISSGVLDRRELVQQIRTLNTQFTEFRAVSERVKTQSASLPRVMRRECLRYAEEIAGYDPKPSPEAAYEKIINIPAIRVVIPGSAPLQLTPAELEARLSRSGTDLLTYISELIETMDLTFYSDLSLAANQKCTGYSAGLESTPDQFEGALANFRSDAAPLATKVITVLTEANLRQSTDLQTFITNAEELLGLAVSVEIVEPETSRDTLLARLTGVCDLPRGGSPDERAELLEIAAELGFDIGLIFDKPAPELCRILNQSFA